MRKHEVHVARPPSAGSILGPQPLSAASACNPAARRGRKPTSGGLLATALLLTALPSPAAGGGPPQAFDLAAAIRDAAPGQTIRVPAGVYAGPVVIDKSISLAADGDAVIDGRGAGDVVRITAADAGLRGFRLRGTGAVLDRENAGVSVTAPRATVEDNLLEDVLFGISLSNAAGSVVRGNIIRGKALDVARRGDGIRLWNSNDSHVLENSLERVRDLVVWYSQNVELRGNEVRDSRYGMHFMYAGGSRLVENRLERNSVGIFLMYSRDVRCLRNLIAHNRGPSGYGIGLKDMDGVAADENVFLANRVGIYFDNSPFQIDSVQHFTRNIFAYNDVGLAFLPAVSRNRFSDNAFIENVEQVAILGTGDFKGNDFTVAGVGNYWSDYAGFDADGDGTGDVPYRAMSLFENLIDREPKLRLFLYSPAQQAIELAAKAFPVVRPRPKITDSAPRMTAVEAKIATRDRATAWPMSGVSAGILGLGALAWTRLRRRDGEAGAASATMTECGGAAAAAFTARPVAEAGEAAEAAADIVAIRGLSKSFGRHVAVNEFSLDIQAGEGVALWGVNGAGKTTIIKCVLGLYGYRGQVRIGGCDARRDGKRARRMLGYVSQQLSFYDDLTALDNVRLFARLKRIDPRRAGAVLSQVGLAEHARKRFGALSGGMKQRLALAVALLGDPPILLLDEPTSNLDEAARRTFLALLAGLKHAGKAILFSTHRREEVEILADRVIVLEQGKTVAEGAPAAIEALLNLRVNLRIALPRESREAALAALRAAGFAASNNCAGVIVPVAPSQKAGPLHVLSGAGIRAENFEIESEVADVR